MSDVRRLLVERGYDIVGRTPEEYTANIRSEMAKWERVVKSTSRIKYLARIIMAKDAACDMRRRGR